MMNDVAEMIEELDDNSGVTDNLVSVIAKSFKDKKKEYDFRYSIFDYFIKSLLREFSESEIREFFDYFDFKKYTRVNIPSNLYKRLLNENFSRALFSDYFKGPILELYRSVFNNLKTIIHEESKLVKKINAEFLKYASHHQSMIFSAIYSHWYNYKIKEDLLSSLNCYSVDDVNAFYDIISKMIIYHNKNYPESVKSFFRVYENISKNEESENLSLDFTYLFTKYIFPTLNIRFQSIKDASSVVDEINESNFKLLNSFAKNSEFLDFFYNMLKGYYEKLPENLKTPAMLENILKKYIITGY